MSDPSPPIRRAVARWSARAAAIGFAIVVCALPLSSRADAGAPGVLAAAAQPTTTPEVADSEDSEVRFRVNGVQPTPTPTPPPPPSPGLPGTGLDLPVVALAGGAGGLIALGALLVLVVRGSSGRVAGRVARSKGGAE